MNYIVDFIDHSLEYYLTLFSVIGVVSIFYVLILDTIMLEFFVKKNVLKIKEFINKNSPGTYNIVEEHHLGKSYVSRSIQYGYRVKSFGLSFINGLKSWNTLKTKIFKGVDVESEKLNFSKEVAVLKRSYYINKIATKILIILFITTFFLVVYSALTGYRFFLI